MTPKSRNRVPSLRARLVNMFLPLLGTKAQFSSQQRLTKYLASKAQRSAPPSHRLRREFQVEEQKTCEVSRFVLTPRSGASDLTILYIHGGAYVNELTSHHWRIIAGIARRTGASVHVPLYPLAPSHTWADAFPAVHELAAQLIQTPGKSVTFMGDSAGAGFALALAQVMRDARELLPSHIVLLSPWLDVATNHPDQALFNERDRMLAAPGLQWAGRKWAGNLPVQDPRVSPVHGSLLGLPPTLVLTGTADLLYPDAKRLQDKARQANHPLAFIEYPGMFHVWMAAPIPEARQALDDVACFMTVSSQSANDRF